MTGQDGIPNEKRGVNRQERSRTQSTFSLPAWQDDGTGIVSPVINPGNKLGVGAKITPGAKKAMGKTQANIPTNESMRAAADSMNEPMRRRQAEIDAEDREARRKKVPPALKKEEPEVKEPEVEEPEVKEPEVEEPEVEDTPDDPTVIMYYYMTGADGISDIVRHGDEAAWAAKHGGAVYMYPYSRIPNDGNQYIVPQVLPDKELLTGEQMGMKAPEWGSYAVPGRIPSTVYGTPDLPKPPSPAHWWE